MNRPFESDGDLRIFYRNVIKLDVGSLEQFHVSKDQRSIDDAVELLIDVDFNFADVRHKGTLPLTIKRDDLATFIAVLEDVRVAKFGLMDEMRKLDEELSE